MSLCNSYCCPLSKIYSCNDNNLCKPEKKIFFLRFGVLCHLSGHIYKKVHGLCGYNYGESPLNLPQYIDQSQDSICCDTTYNHKTHDLRYVFCIGTKHKS